MKRIWLYALTIILLGFLGRALDGNDISAFKPGPGQLLFLISPILVALLFRWIFKETHPWGLRLQLKTSWSWLLICAVLFPIVLYLLTILGIKTGDISQLKKLWTTTFFSAVIIAIPFQFVKNIFEEFVWRGYLFSKLEASGVSYLKNHLIVGLIWACWHLPYLDVFASTYHNLSPYLYIPLFIIGVTLSAIIYGEIRRRSGTVWTAVILHTFGNAFVNVLFHEDYISLHDGDAWLIAPSIDNVSYILVVGIIAFLFYTNSLNTSAKKNTTHP